MLRRILHIAPTYYSATSVVGGGEKYIVYMSRSLREAAGSRGLVIHNSILAFGQNPGVYRLADDIICEVLPGTPWQYSGISLDDLKRHIAESDIVVVHQCLSPLGLFGNGGCTVDWHERWWWVLIMGAVNIP